MKAEKEKSDHEVGLYIFEIDSTSKSDAQDILSISRKILMSYAEQIHLLNFNKHFLAFNASNKFGAGSGSLIYSLVSREQLDLNRLKI